MKLVADIRDWHKVCRLCGLEKPLSEFTPRKISKDGYRTECKPCRSATARDQARRRISRGNFRDRDRYAKWRSNNVAHDRERCREWGKRNIDRVLAYKRSRYASMPEVRLRDLVSSGVRRSLNGRKKSAVFDLLPYSIDDLKTHLQRQFKRGMTWENYGEWHIDHIVPLSAFKISDAECKEFVRAWALANLRPLWAKENLCKSNCRETLL